MIEAEIYALAARWRSTTIEEFEPTPEQKDIVWFGSTASISDEWRTTLRKCLPTIERLSGQVNEDPDELRDLLRWDVQEPRLRLLSRYVDGISWIVVLDSLGSQIPVTTPKDDSFHEIAADTVRKLDAFIAALEAGGPYRSVTSTLSPIFSATARLLSATEVAIARCG